jgi:HK97 family phage prohead protease
MLAPNDLTRPAAIDADGTVEGYASLFGEIDQARDMVMPGAFEASLRSRGVRRVPMLFQHDPAEPIGVWLELREDVRGLYARGRLIPEVVRARELLALLKAGGADGLSIGFRTVRGRLDPLEVFLLRSDEPAERVVVGPDLRAGQLVQLFIPGGTFHTARLLGRSGWFLGASTEWPGVVPRDVQIGNVDELAAKYPQFAQQIRAIAAVPR